MLKVSQGLEEDRGGKKREYGRTRIVCIGRAIHEREQQEQALEKERVYGRIGNR